MPVRTDPALAKWLIDVQGVFTAAAAAAGRKAGALKRPVLATAVGPAPNLDLLEVFEAGRRAADRVVWLRPQEAFGLVGVGAAWSFITDGAERFGMADTAWRAIAEDGCGEGFPIAFYGFAFADETSGPPEYPAGLVTLPRVAIRQSAGDASVILTAVITPDASSVAECDETLACANMIGAALGSGAGAAAPREASRPLRVVGEFPAEAQWKEAVRETARAVRCGLLQKAVLARGVRVRGGRLRAGGVLHALRQDYPDCTVFAVGRGRRCFLGATPERLVGLHGLDVAVEALAGSAARGQTDHDDRAFATSLLGSAKDRVEHAVVVDALREALFEISTAVSVPARPRLLTVRNTHHLYTPLRAVLRRRCSVLDLAGRLHPTPAVGGVPRGEALRWIRRHERFDRGWYAGPVGWIDAGGDGEAAVAIRSGLLDEKEATLFAGCGIVADSDPDQEFAESQWKLRPLLSALGEASAFPDAYRAPDAPGADACADRDVRFGS